MVMEFKFVPSLVSSGEFSGHIMLRMPSYEEKMELLNSMELEADSEGKPDQTALKKNLYRGMARVGIKSKEFISKIELLRQKDKTKFETWEQLNYDSDGHTIINEIAGRLISKMSVGKN